MTIGVIAATAASSVCWALFDFSRKKIAGRFEPVPVVIWLMVVQVPVFAAAGLSEIWIFPESRYWLPALASTLLNCLANVFFIESIRLAPLSLAIPILSLGPVFSLIGAFLMLGEQASVRQLFGIVIIVLAAFGLGRMGSRDAKLSRENPRESGKVGLGLLLMALVAALWSTTPVLDKICMRSMPASEHGFLQCLSVALALFVWLRIRSRAALSMSDLKRTGTVRWFLISGVVASIALLSQLWAIQEIPVGIFEALKRAYGMMSALLLGFLFLDESITKLKAIVVLVMVIGVFVLLV